VRNTSNRVYNILIAGLALSFLLAGLISTILFSLSLIFWNVILFKVFKSYKKSSKIRYAYAVVIGLNTAILLYGFGNILIN